MSSKRSSIENQRPGWVYGTLQVRAGEGDEDYVEGYVRVNEVARVSLASGKLLTEDYLSRDCYDWCCDTFVFLPFGSDEEITVEEGETSEFCVDEDDLPALALAHANAQAQQLKKQQPKARPRAKSGARL